MLPFLASLAPVLLQAGTSYFAQKSAQKQREKELKAAKRRAAFANMVGSMGGQAMAPAGVPGAAQGDPVWAAAQGLTADPIVHDKIEDLVNKLMGKLPEKKSEDLVGKRLKGLGYL